MQDTRQIMAIGWRHYHPGGKHTVRRICNVESKPPKATTNKYHSKFRTESSWYLGWFGMVPSLPPSIILTIPALHIMPVLLRCLHSIRQLHRVGDRGFADYGSIAGNIGGISLLLHRTHPHSRSAIPHVCAPFRKPGA